MRETRTNGQMDGDGREVLFYAVVNGKIISGGWGWGEGGGAGNTTSKDIEDRLGVYDVDTFYSSSYRTCAYTLRSSTAFYELKLVGNRYYPACDREALPILISK